MAAGWTGSSLSRVPRMASATGRYTGPVKSSGVKSFRNPPQAAGSVARKFSRSRWSSWNPSSFSFFFRGLPSSSRASGSAVTRRPP